MNRGKNRKIVGKASVLAEFELKPYTAFYR